MPFGTFPPQLRRRVAVTGLGAVTPLGLDVPTTWNAVCAGLSATRALSEAPFFTPACIASERESSEAARRQRRDHLLAAMPCLVAAPVLPSGESGAPSFAPTTRETRATLFTHHAVQEALAHAQLIPRDAQRAAWCVKSVARDRVGVHIGVGMPSLADTGDVSHSLYADPARVHYSRVNPLFVPKILGNMAAGLTAMRYGLTGPIGSGVAACATGAHCIGESAEWIRGGRADVMVCGGAEACITPVAIAGFSRMRALCTKYNDRPREASRPFDAARGGFIMGEGAGIMVLEEFDHARRRGATIFAELRGFGVSSDAHDVAAPHPDGRGAQQCMRVALDDGGSVPAAAVGYVNAHATGTMGDDVELRAIAASLRRDLTRSVNDKESTDAVGRHPHRSGSLAGGKLWVSSSKGGLGHLLGAAGSVEAIIATMALFHHLAPPTVNLTTPSASLDQMPDLGLVKGNAPQPFEGEAVISTSFGFGGVNTALLFTQAETSPE